MGAYAGPEIAESGLVLALDAGNLKSYPGSGTTWTDIIGRGNTGTLTNGPTYSNQNGGSIVFNGVNNYVENLSPNLGISGDTSVTLSCWFFNSKNTSNNQALLVYGNGSTGGDSISILLRNLSFYASFNGGLDAVIADNVYALNTWNNVVVTKTPGAINTTTKLYLNGVEQTITSASSSTPSLSSRVVRVARWTADASPFYLQGGVSAALIYNRALSAAEVLQNYNSLKNRFVTAPVLIPPGPYRISRSLRFNSADSAYLNRTPSVAGNRKTWTWAAWVKRSALTDTFIFTSNYPSGPWFGFGIVSDKLYLSYTAGINATGENIPIAVLRDLSAWYHVVLAFDTTQATASNRIKMYVNGTPQTLSVSNPPALNTNYQVNNTVQHLTGGGIPGYYFNAYLADVHFVDGQALTPSSFTETNATTGQLVPKDYTGTYGTNGFRLNFSDNSAATAATLGADSGGGISAATGALPIYNTTDNYGITKGTGTRTDANASSLVLAIPMDGANNGTTFTDESATIRGSGSAKAITVVGNTKTLTAQSKFYGSSGFFDGNGDYLSIPDDVDFDLGSSNFTIEGFVYVTATSGSQQTFIAKGTGANFQASYHIALTAGGTWVYYLSGNGSTWSIASAITIGTNALNTWQHIALVRNGSTFTPYLNGVAGTPTTSSTALFDSNKIFSVGADDPGNQLLFGYIQDLRIYKGVAKYTANFTPPLGPNNWTPNNLSVTAGAGNDSLTDTPTSYGTDTGAGGEVGGNYCTWNPLANTAGALSNGNLHLGGTSSPFVRCNSTLAVSSGKWYFEATLTTAQAFTSVGIGQGFITNKYPGEDALSYAQTLEAGTRINNNAQPAYGTALTNGNVFMCAFDLDNNKIFFGKNGTWFNSSNPVAGTSPAYTLAAGTYCPIARPYSTGAVLDANFGQRPFAYAAPSGFKALCDTNLPTPTIAKGSSVFDTKLYTGNGSTQTISGLGFSPDFVWIKQRDSTNVASHVLVDIVRGNNNVLRTNGSDAENSVGINPALYDGITNLSTTSFDVVKGSSTVYNGTNGSGKSYVAWAWDAGSSTVTNTAGTITSQVRANASAGFSVVTYTGTGANATVGHGLGVAPSLILCKTRAVAVQWTVYHASLGKDLLLGLNTTDASIFYSNYWGSAVTSTVFGLQNLAGGNNNGNMVAYCFAPVSGYSSFGSYTGNDSADGPFVFCNFRPAVVLVKMSSSTGNWTILDDKREGYNVDNNPLYPNLFATEGATDLIDITSNGFKVRTTDAAFNTNAGTYIYAAWASSPFAYSRAR